MSFEPIWKLLLSGVKRETKLPPLSKLFVGIVEHQAHFSNSAERQQLTVAYLGHQQETARSTSCCIRSMKGTKMSVCQCTKNTEKENIWQLTYIVQNSLILMVFRPNVTLKLTSSSHASYCRHQKLLFWKSTPLWCQKRTEVLLMPHEWWSCFLCSGRTEEERYWSHHGETYKKGCTIQNLWDTKEMHRAIIIFNAAEVYTNTRQQTQHPTLGNMGWLFQSPQTLVAVAQSDSALNFCLYQGDLTSAASQHHIQTGDTTSLLFVDRLLPLGVVETDRPRWHSQSRAALHLWSRHSRQVICHSWREEG